MKANFRNWLAPFLLLALAGCDPRYDVDYEISNSTDESISIYVNHPWIDQDTNTISGGTRLVFFTATGLGYNTNQYLNDLDTIAFEIYITNSSGMHFKKNTGDISNWEKYYPDKSEGIGKVQLVVRNEDFE